MGAADAYRTRAGIEKGHVDHPPTPREPEDPGPVDWGKTFDPGGTPENEPDTPLGVDNPPAEDPHSWPADADQLTLD